MTALQQIRTLHLATLEYNDSQRTTTAPETSAKTSVYKNNTNRCCRAHEQFQVHTNPVIKTFLFKTNKEDYNEETSRGERGAVLPAEKSNSPFFHNLDHTHSTRESSEEFTVQRLSTVKSIESSDETKVKKLKLWLGIVYVCCWNRWDSSF